MSTDHNPDDSTAIGSDTAASTTDSPSPGTVAESENQSRAPPVADDPPRGATRSMGGTCPDCGGPMVSRLRTEFEERHDQRHAQLRLSAVCDDCSLWLEGKTPAVRLTVNEV